MTQVQCKNCKQTFQHEAALREHWRTSLTCAVATVTPKYEDDFWKQMITNVKPHPWQQEHMLGRDRTSRDCNDERERGLLIQVDQMLTREVRRMEEQFHRTLKARDEKIAALERALASYSFNVTRHRSLPEKPDYTQWVDEEDCLTTVDKHHGFPTRERIKF